MDVINFNINESEIYTEELIKITYLSSTSWVKIVYAINQQFPTYYDIISSAKQQFNISTNDVILLDACDIIVPHDLFDQFIKNYDRGNFGFKLITKFTSSDILDLDKSSISQSPTSVSTVSSDCSWNFSDNTDNCPIKFPERKRLVENLLRKDLEQYIKHQKNIDINGQTLLDNYRKHQFLTTKDRIKVINIIADHIQLNNSHITRDDKILWAKATIQIFPCLRDETTEGKYEIVYDPKTRGGFLGNRLKTLNKILIKKNKIFHISQSKDPVSDTDQISNHSLEFHINFLKSASTISETDDIKGSLRATLHHRQSLITKKESDKIPETYPILLKTVELIHFEFELNQPGKCHKFLEFWNESIESKIILSAEQSRNGLIENLGLCTSLKALLCLLTLCPPSVKGRGSTNKCGVEAAFGKLVVLHEPNTSLEQKTTINKQPYIIASGRNLNEIDNYYVAVDGNILHTGSELKPAIDICFKVHYIFNIEYDENLRILWGYIQHFIYQINLNQVSTCMRLCNALLNNNIEPIV